MSAALFVVKLYSADNLFAWSQNAYTKFPQYIHEYSDAKW